MKAFLRVENNSIIENKKKKLADIKTEIEINTPIRELAIYNKNLNLRKGDIFETDNYTITQLKDKKYKSTFKIKNYINSYEVFISTYNLGKKIDEYISDNIFNDINKSDNIYNVYKQVILSLLESNSKIVLELSELILDFFDNYGFVVLYDYEDYLSTKDECIIYYYLLFTYLIYESFLLRINLADNRKIYSKIYSFINNAPSNNELLEHIDNNLKFLDSKITNHCYFKTIFDNKNESWNTNIIFNNPLVLSIYELKIQLSRDNNDETIGICKNPACNNSFKRIGFRQQYCLEYECNLSRQSQRKRKSRNNKKKKSSTK